MLQFESKADAITWLRDFEGVQNAVTLDKAVYLTGLRQAVLTRRLTGEIDLVIEPLEMGRRSFPDKRAAVQWFSENTIGSPSLSIGAPVPLMCGGRVASLAVHDGHHVANIQAA